MAEPSEQGEPRDSSANSESRASEESEATYTSIDARKQRDMPKDFGRYRIEKELGSGGMGAVYLAHDSQLDRKVALKVPFFERRDRDSAIERFGREARAMATVQHPNLCPVYDVGQFEEWHFLTMAFIDGEPLTARLKGNRLTIPQAVKLLRTVALALQKAHEAGIIHRDLKPANIMLDRDLEPIVMDFGLARREHAGETELTNTQAILGSPAYMAPEQVEARHDEIGPATDVYAMGVILYQMLTGQRPFRGSMASTFAQILTDTPELPSSLCPGLPPLMDSICARAIAKSQEDRYRSAAEFAEDLSRYLDQFEDHLLVSQPAISSAALGESGSSAGTGSSGRRSREALRRQVTVMICNCDAVDPEESLLSLDPEEQRDALDAFQRLCETVTNRYEGTVVQSTGQELLVCFGFPVAYEDAAQRAVRTGLGILDEMQALNGDLTQRGKPSLAAWMAIHTGMVVAGESSDSESSIDALSIIGEARTVTSRLEALTDPNQVVISDATHRLVEGFFVCESQGQQKIRGVSRPMEIFEVVEERVVQSRVELLDPEDLTPLVGRDMELGILKDRWEHAVEGMGQVVLLIGEAGLGKSRLVREVKEHIATDDESPGHVVEWRCSAYHEGSSYYPVVTFFEQLLGFQRDDSPGARFERLLQHLQSLNLADPEDVALFCSLLSITHDGSDPSIELSPARQKERTQELLMEWLHAYSSQQAVLFVVEDLHWVDPTTLDFLSLYVEQGLNENVMAVMSFRPEFRTPWQSYSHMTQVALTRLTKRQIGEMIRRKMGVEKVPNEVIAKLSERTDGVPLFVEEFARLVADSGALKDNETSEGLAEALGAIPVTLHDLLAARLDRLGSDPDTAQLGAAIGREFGYGLLAAASELQPSELQAELQKLVEAELLFQKGRPPQATYIFKHALIQDAAYNSLLKQKRQQFHRRIAEALENDGQTAATQPEWLAHHYTEAGAIGLALPHWLAAGQLAQKRSANAEAIHHLTRGLDLLATQDESSERDQRELGFQLTLAPVLMASRGWSAPEVGTAIERARQLVDKFGAVEDRFFVMWGLWGWRVIRAEMDQCTAVAQELMKLVEQSSEGEALLSEALWVVGCTAYYKGEFRDGLELLEEGLERIDPNTEQMYALKTGQFCSAMCRSHTALALWQLGHPDQALRRADETVRLAKELDHPFTYAMSLFFRRQVLEFCGRRDEARVSIEEEYNVCHEHGFVFFQVHAIFGRGEQRLRDGNLAEGRELFDLGLKTLEATGGHLSMDHPYRNIAEACLDVGLYDDAKTWLQRGFDLVNLRHKRGMESEFLRLQGELAMVDGDVEGAERLYRQAIQVARQQQARSWELRATMSLANLKRSQGEAAEAQEMLAASYNAFDEGRDTADHQAAKALLDL